MMRLSRRIATAMVAVAWAGTALAATPRTESAVPGIDLTPLADLPQAPAGGPGDKLCLDNLRPPASDAGKAVAGLGWVVGSEARLGSYQVVSFASAFQLSRSGICAVRNGNIAIFAGGRLVALAYGNSAESGLLGRVQPIDGGGLSVWRGDDPRVALGELRDQAGTLRLSAAAAAGGERVCSGKAVLPSLDGKTIKDARAVLSAQGWTPLPATDMPGGTAPNQYDRASKLVKNGFVEAETCAGTGAGNCIFNYRSAAGTLGVITATGTSLVNDGTDDTVVDTKLSCQ